MSALPREMSRKFIMLKKEHEKNCEELVRLKEVLELKTVDCQAYLNIVQSLERQLKQQSELQCQVDNAGLNRRNLTNSEWYNKNKTHRKFAHYFYGIYDTWEEIKHFIGALFPKVDINYIYKGPHVDVSDFEKVLLCIMRARRDYNITTLAIIIGRDTGMVSRYLDQWMPKLGKVGSYLSILDMDLTADFMTSAECEQEGLLHYNNHPDEYKNFFDACIRNKFVDV